MAAKYKANTIGNWFAAWAIEEGNPLSKTKISKIVSYAQVQYIYINGEPLFDDLSIEAWKFGPVVVDLLGITIDTSDIIKPEQDFSWDMVDEEISAFLISVWNTYGQMNSNEIVEFSHHEDFWAEVYYKDIKDKKIEIDFIKEIYYQKDLEKNLA